MPWIVGMENVNINVDADVNLSVSVNVTAKEAVVGIDLGVSVGGHRCSPSAAWKAARRGSCGTS